MYLRVKNLFFVKYSTYNPFENEDQICQRMNCGVSMYQCEECILVTDKDGEYYFHQECARIELIQNRYISLYSQKYNKDIVIN